jgi:hypothetical protein
VSLRSLLHVHQLFIPLHIYTEDVVGSVTSVTEFLVRNNTTARILKFIKHPPKKHRSFLLALADGG